MSASHSINDDILPSKPVGRAPTPQEPIVSQESQEPITDCIRLLAPMKQNEAATFVINTTRNLALENHGCVVTTIGDGMRDLNKNDLDNFNKVISSSRGPILLDIRAHGGILDGVHYIQLGEHYIVTTRSVIESALEHAGDKRVDIISEACHSGQYCNEAQLPDKARYLGMSDDTIYSGNIRELSKLLYDQPMDLSAENILKLSLTKNYDLPIIGGVIPHVCTKRSNFDLTELLKTRSGIQFTDGEKNYITKELSPFLTNPDQLPSIIHKIENNEINESTRFNNMALYGNALAIAFVAQQYHERNNPPTKQSIMFNPLGNPVSAISNGLTTLSSTAMLHFDNDSVLTSLKLSDFSKEKKPLSQNPASSNPVSKDSHDDNHHPNIALEIYHDLIHIRNHALGVDKEVPKLLRLPVVSFIAAMSANQGSKHPVRDSLIDMGVESSVLTSMGLAIGNTPAAMTLFASHLAQTGLHHFPTWEQIDKMPRSTVAERYAYSRMIEARAMGELLAWPSKVTATLSRYVKSFMDDVLSKLDPDKDLSSSNSLLAAEPMQFQQSPLPLLGKQDNSLVVPQSLPIIGPKAPELSLSSPSPLVSQSLFADKKPSELSGKTAWDSMRSQLSHSERVEDKPYIPFLPSKLSGLSGGTEHKSAWDAIRLKQADFPHSSTLPSMQALQPRVFEAKPTLTEFSLGSAPKSAWDKLASTSQFANHAAPSLFNGHSLWQPASSGSGSTPQFGASFSGISSLEPRSSGNLSMSSKSQLSYQPFPNAWDKVRDAGMNHFNRALRK